MNDLSELSKIVGVELKVVDRKEKMERTINKIVSDKKGFESRSVTFTSKSDRGYGQGRNMGD